MLRLIVRFALNWKQTHKSFNNKSVIIIIILILISLTLKTTDCLIFLSQSSTLSITCINIREMWACHLHAPRARHRWRWRLLLRVFQRRHRCLCQTGIQFGAQDSEQTMNRIGTEIQIRDNERNNGSALREQNRLLRPLRNSFKCYPKTDLNFFELKLRKTLIKTKQKLILHLILLSD